MPPNADRQRRHRQANGEAARVARPARPAEALPPEGVHVVTSLGYFLTLSADLNQRVVGQIQGGSRVDLDYTGGNASVLVRDDSRLQPSTRAQLNGAVVLSGSDWAFVSDDAVVDFDARITIKLADQFGLADQPRLIAGRIRGRADLRACLRPNGARMFAAGVSEQDVLNKWRSGFGAGASLPLTLAVSLDVPAKGFDDAETQAYHDCRELGRSLFVGVGSVTFRDGVFGAPAKITLDLHRIAADEVIQLGARPARGDRAAGEGA